MSPSAAKFLADTIVVLHLAFVIFAFLGATAVLWRLWVAWLHLPSMLWVIYVAAMNAICPLTPLENDLRRDAGVAEYEGGFVDHYVKPVLYPEGLTDADQHKLAGVVIALNLACYAAVVVKWRRRRRRAKPANEPLAEPTPDASGGQALLTVTRDQEDRPNVESP